MSEARVFDDFRYANGIKKLRGGKVIMLSDAPKAPRKEPKVESPKPEIPPQEPVKPLPQKTKIPGKFIVLTDQGYYISKTRFTPHRAEARIFDDFRYANGIRKLRGGKVIKL